MKFFTDHTVKNDYLLITIKNYLRFREKEFNFDKYKEVFIDPGVYELTKGRESYSWEKKVNIHKFLESLPENHYFSFDYPADMYPPNQELFLRKSFENAEKYQNYKQFIITVQFRLGSWLDYIVWLNRYSRLNSRGILGIGNMCRMLYLTKFVKNVINYTFKNVKNKRIHIYGLGLRSLPYAIRKAKRYNKELSFDSTKWKRAFWMNTKKEHLYPKINNKYKYCRATPQDDQMMFDTYKNEIIKRVNEI